MVDEGEYLNLKKMLNYLESLVDYYNQIETYCVA